MNYLRPCLHLQSPLLCVPFLVSDTGILSESKNFIPFNSPALSAFRIALLSGTVNLNKDRFESSAKFTYASSVISSLVHGQAVVTRAAPQGYKPVPTGSKALSLEGSGPVANSGWSTPMQGRHASAECRRCGAPVADGQPSRPSLACKAHSAAICAFDGLGPLGQSPPHPRAGRRGSAASAARLPREGLEPPPRPPHAPRPRSHSPFSSSASSAGPAGPPKASIRGSSGPSASTPAASSARAAIEPCPALHPRLRRLLGSGSALKVGGGLSKVALGSCPPHSSVGMRRHASLACAERRGPAVPLLREGGAQECRRCGAPVADGQPSRPSLACKAHSAAICAFDGLGPLGQSPPHPRAGRRGSAASAARLPREGLEPPPRPPHAPRPRSHSPFSSSASSAGPAGPPKASIRGSSGPSASTPAASSARAAIEPCPALHPRLRRLLGSGSALKVGGGLSKVALGSCPPHSSVPASRA